jgi:hypothetical protein
MTTRDKGGAIAANFRRANIAEGLATQMIRVFAAVAPVPREEDFGIDLVATLLAPQGRRLIARESFFIQVKIRTAASFEFAGDGVDWLRQMRLPYFPVVIDLEQASVSIYTINRDRIAFAHNSAVSRFVFRPSDDVDELDDFSLGEPLMKWTLEDASHPDFPVWACSVLRPAIEVETFNQHYGRAQSFIPLVWSCCEFKDRTEEGFAKEPPQPGEMWHLPPGDGEFIKGVLERILDPFAGWISNTGKYDRHGDELLKIRAAFKILGVNADPKNSWDEIVDDMKSYVADQGAQDA